MYRPIKSLIRKSPSATNYHFTILRLVSVGSLEDMKLKPGSILLATYGYGEWRCGGSEFQTTGAAIEKLRQHCYIIISSYHLDLLRQYLIMSKLHRLPCIC